MLNDKEKQAFADFAKANELTRAQCVSLSILLCTSTEEFLSQCGFAPSTNVIH